MNTHSKQLHTFTENAEASAVKVSTSLCNSKTKSKIELLGFSFDSDCLKDGEIISFFTKSFPKSEYVVVVTQNTLGGEDRVSLNAFLAKQTSGTPNFSCSFASVCGFASFAATLLPWSRESLRTAQGNNFCDNE